MRKTTDNLVKGNREQERGTGTAYGVGFEPTHDAPTDLYVPYKSVGDSYPQILLRRKQETGRSSLFPIPRCLLVILVCSQF